MAVHLRSQKRVAIKILNRKKLAEMNMSAKIQTEIDILAKCRHPHVVRLYEVIESETDIYAVMEYVPEGELFEYIVAKSKLDEVEALRLFQQIISGRKDRLVLMFSYNQYIYIYIILIHTLGSNLTVIRIWIHRRPGVLSQQHGCASRSQARKPHARP